MEVFNSMTRAIVNAEAPIFRVNSKIKELGVTLANTARWQLSSSIIHGLMGGMQKAYYYAQNLNRSLNDIRIVTRYSAEQMKDFAVEANKAAKALSTTTTNYTNASLIYYQ
jgi:TP901 family phage tail tape measure protein